MILVFIFLIFIIGCVFSKISVYVEDFNLNNNLEKLNAKFNIKIKFKLYGLIPFFVISLKEDGIRILGIRIDYKKIIENKNIQNGIKKAQSNFKFASIKMLKPNLENINLKLSLGTESVIITTFLVTICSFLLTYIFKKTINKFDGEKHKYIISPNYKEENKIFLEFKGNLDIKTSNIIECIKYS